jgi:hypothetical protein
MLNGKGGISMSGGQCSPGCSKLHHSPPSSMGIGHETDTL